MLRYHCWWSLESWSRVPFQGCLKQQATLQWIVSPNRIDLVKSRKKRSSFPRSRPLSLLLFKKSTWSQFLFSISSPNILSYFSPASELIRLPVCMMPKKLVPEPLSWGWWVEGESFFSLLSLCCSHLTIQYVRLFTCSILFLRTLTQLCNYCTTSCIMHLFLKSHRGEWGRVSREPSFFPSCGCIDRERRRREKMKRRKNKS